MQHLSLNDTSSASQTVDAMSNKSSSSYPDREVCRAARILKIYHSLIPLTLSNTDRDILSDYGRPEIDNIT